MDAAPKAGKIIRSYRLVFRRRWRIFRIQGWRIPLPGGVELRLLGYWVICLLAAFLVGRLPLVGTLVSLMPVALRLLALPIAAAWALARLEVDGRPPHRALLGLLSWRLRPRSLAGLRRCPSEQTELVPLDTVVLGPDLSSSRYPSGTVEGPARLLLRYPVAAESGRGLLRRRPPWHLRQLRLPPLHQGKTIELPAGHTISFGPPQ